MLDLFFKTSVKQSRFEFLKWLNFAVIDLCLCPVFCSQGHHFKGAGKWVYIDMRYCQTEQDDLRPC